MIYHYDLHIHSVLSPCADDLMTPNNIINMATLKNLNIIAVTDHNSLLQLPVLQEIAESYSLLLVPGVEITTSEQIHVVCYFKEFEQAMRFEQEIAKHRVKDDQDPGSSRLTDHEDYIIGTVENVSSKALNLSIEKLCSLLKNYDHLLFLAHLDRPNTAGLAYLDRLKPNGIELTKCDMAFITDHRLSCFPILYNSDAHDLMSISEADTLNTIELEKLDIEAFFRFFNHG
jgi:3',5'-nucleoside bisphosphate phosphatase